MTSEHSYEIKKIPNKDLYNLMCDHVVIASELTLGDAAIILDTLLHNDQSLTDERR